MRTKISFFMCSLFPLFFLFISNQAMALEIKIKEVNPLSAEPLPGHPVLFLEGEIYPGDYDKLLNFIINSGFKSFSTRDIVLASGGGDVNEAIKIANFVKGTYSVVYAAPMYGKCVSACFMIYAAAVKRMALPGSVGIHRPYLDPKKYAKLTPQKAENLQNQALTHARKFLLENDVPTNIVDVMFNTSSDKVYWLTKKQLNQIGMRASYYEEYLIEECGLDKAKEKKYYEGDKKLLSYTRKVARCGMQSTEKEAIKFVFREYKKQLKSGKISIDSLFGKSH